MKAIISRILVLNLILLGVFANCSVNEKSDEELAKEFTNNWKDKTLYFKDTLLPRCFDFSIEEGKCTKYDIHSTDVKKEAGLCSVEVKDDQIILNWGINNSELDKKEVLYLEDEDRQKLNGDEEEFKDKYDSDLLIKSKTYCSDNYKTNKELSDDWENAFEGKALFVDREDDSDYCIEYSSNNNQCEQYTITSFAEKAVGRCKVDASFLGLEIDFTEAEGSYSGLENVRFNMKMTEMRKGTEGLSEIKTDKETVTLNEAGYCAENYKTQSGEELTQLLLTSWANKDIFINSLDTIDYCFSFTTPMKSCTKLDLYTNGTVIDSTGLCDILADDTTLKILFGEDETSFDSERVLFKEGQRAAITGEETSLEFEHDYTIEIKDTGYCASRKE